jgi:hypothetical protein
MPRKKKSETIIENQNNEITENIPQNDNVDDNNKTEILDQDVNEDVIHDDTTNNSEQETEDVLKMTFDEYDALIEKLEKISYKPEGYYPTVQEIKDNLEPEFDKNFDYIVWLTECNENPDTEEGILARNYLNRLLIKKLVLVDEEDLQKEGDEN